MTLMSLLDMTGQVIGGLCSPRARELHTEYVDSVTKRVK